MFKTVVIVITPILLAGIVLTMYCVRVTAGERREKSKGPL